MYGKLQGELSTVNTKVQLFIYFISSQSQYCKKTAAFQKFKFFISQVPNYNWNVRVNIKKSTKNFQKLLIVERSVSIIIHSTNTPQLANGFPLSRKEYVPVY